MRHVFTLPFIYIYIKTLSKHIHATCIYITIHLCMYVCMYVNGNVNTCRMNMLT